MTTWILTHVITSRRTPTMHFLDQIGWVGVSPNRGNITLLWCIVILIFLGERNYVTFALWLGLSVGLPSVSLSYVTFVRPAKRIELFGNIFASTNTSGTWVVFTKILGKIRRVLGDHAFFDQYLVLFRKRYRPFLQWKTNTNSYICDPSNGAIFNDLQWPLI